MAEHSPGPLDGVVVVAVEQAVAIPFATRQLADLGATVIKIERPDVGDFARSYDGNVCGESAFFIWANRGKHSLVLDTKDPGQRQQLEGLIAGADVFAHNLAPSAAERAGLDPGSVRARHPHVIAVEVSGYGAGGPRSADKAYDLAIQAEAGVFDVNGDGDVGAKSGFSVADIAAGMYAFSGILAALYRRGVTGQGATVSVSMLEALTEWMSAPIYNAVAVGRSPARTARRHAYIAPYGTFALSDGSRVLLAIQSNPEWRRFCEVVLAAPALADDARFATNSDRINNVDSLEQLITVSFATDTPAEIRDRLDRASLAVASVNTLDDVWHHDQLRARGRFVPTRLPSGAMFEMLVPPIGIDGPVHPEAFVPALNEHDPDVIAQIIARGANRPSQ